MSRKATDWVWNQKIKPATHKLVLLSMADRANEEFCCWPSIARVEKDTNLDRKTIQKAINSLAESGYLHDTGGKKGPTRRVRVFQFTELAAGESSIITAKKYNDPKNGTIENSWVTTPKTGQLNDPKNGTLNDPKNGTQKQSLEPVIEPVKKKKVKTASSSSKKPAEKSFPKYMRMTEDWQPSQQAMSELDAVGIPDWFVTSQFSGSGSETNLGEFIEFRINSGKTSGDWDNAFTEDMKRKWGRYMDQQRSVQSQSTRDRTITENLSDRSWAAPLARSQSTKAVSTQ